MKPRKKCALEEGVHYRGCPPQRGFTVVRSRNVLTGFSRNCACELRSMLTKILYHARSS